MEVVDSPARRGDDDVDAPAQTRQLPPDRLAAVDRQHPHAQPSAVLVDRFRHLHGQLTGGAQHQRLGRLAGRCIQVDAAEDRQRERCGLAGAGGRLTDQITPGQHRWNRLGLNRRGLLVAQVGQCLQQLGPQLKGLETARGGLGSLRSRLRLNSSGLRLRLNLNSNRLNRSNGLGIDRCWRRLRLDSSGHWLRLGIINHRLRSNSSGLRLRLDSHWHGLGTRRLSNGWHRFDNNRPDSNRLDSNRLGGNRLGLGLGGNRLGGSRLGDSSYRLGLRVGIGGQHKLALHGLGRRSRRRRRGSRGCRVRYLFIDGLIGPGGFGGHRIVRHNSLHTWRRAAASPQRRRMALFARASIVLGPAGPLRARIVALR